jgi:hypothetical protein
MNKTPKATLFKKLESHVTDFSPAPSSVDTYIVDGFYFLDLCVDLPM